MSNILGRRSDTEQQQQLAKYANRLDIQKIHTSVTLFFCLFVCFYIEWFIGDTEETFLFTGIVRDIFYLGLLTGT